MLAIGTWVLLCFSALLFVIYLFVSTFMRKRRIGEPAVVAGRLLWGSAIEFGTDAVNFLHRATRQYGSVFTLRLVNQYITIINDPHCYEAVSKEKNFDFDPIQKQVNLNVFSFVLREPKKMIKDTGRTVRGSKLPTSMGAYVQKLNAAYEKTLTNPSYQGTPTIEGWHKDGLRKFTANTIFDALFNTIFGDSDHHVFNSQNTYRNFETFHKYFNFMWLGLPGRLFRPAMKALEEMVSQPTSDEFLARDDLSEYVRLAIEYMQEKGQSESDIKGHNLVYLHVNYNTFRLAFWVLDNLLENPKAYEALMGEIQEQIHARTDEEGVARFNVKSLEAMPILDSIYQETMRISSGVFMIRYVNEDTEFTTPEGTTHLIRKGDRVAMYPPAIHKDPEIFENPEEFQYNRFVGTTFSKNGKEVKNPVIGFGSLCPGKRFAICQLKWYILTVLTRFQVEIKDGEHAVLDNDYNGHEILPPAGDVEIKYRERPSYPHLAFDH